MFASLRHPSFRFLWLSTLLWSIPRWMEAIVVAWLVLELTGSPFLVGIVMAVRHLPFLLFGAIGGVVADRVSSRPRLLVVAQLWVMAITASMVLLASTGTIQVWHLAVLTFLSASAIAFDQPTRQTLIYDIVRKDLVNALALNSSAWNISRIIGPAAGGVLLAWSGALTCFVFMSFCYLLGIGCLLAVGRPARARPPQSGSVLENLSEGIKYAFRNPVTRSLLTLEIVTDIVAFPYVFVLTPVIARDVLGVGATGLGFMTAAAGIGALLGTLGIAALGERLKKGQALLVTSFFYGLSLLIFSTSTWYPLSVLLIGATGMFTAVQVNLQGILLQTTVPEEMRGRMMGAYVLTWGVMPAGNLQAGAVASLVGAPVAGVAGGLILAVFALILARVSPLRRS